MKCSSSFFFPFENCAHCRCAPQNKEELCFQETQVKRNVSLCYKICCGIKGTSCFTCNVSDDAAVQKTKLSLNAENNSVSAQAYVSCGIFSSLYLQVKTTLWCYISLNRWTTVFLHTSTVFTVLEQPQVSWENQRGINVALFSWEVRALEILCMKCAFKQIWDVKVGEWEEFVMSFWFR